MPERWDSVIRMNNHNVLTQLSSLRPVLWLFLLLSVFLAGIRFSDGGMLLAISRGATISDPIFKEVTTQYVWDSPLKIFLLQALPAKVIVIAVVFAALAVLPVVALTTWKNHRLIWLGVATLALTPALKVSVQNIGVGDGLVIFLVLLLFYLHKLWLIGLAFFVLALWHPHQSFFIGFSYLIARYCYAEDFDKREVFVVLGSLVCAALIFFLYKASLGFNYGGRETYLMERLQYFIHRNIAYAPISFLPIALWFFFVAPSPARASFLLIGWLAILGVVSLLMTDVTRVMTITSLPIVLMGASKLFDSATSVASSRFFLVAGLIALIPPYSWAGLDFWLWTDFAGDLCKWRIYCG